MHSFQNAQIQIDLLNREDALWNYTVKPTGKSFNIAGPVFEVDGKLHSTPLSNIAMIAAPLQLTNGCLEYHYEGQLASNPDMLLEIIFRIAENNPVVRFHYVLKSNAKLRLTKVSDHDKLQYFSTSLEQVDNIKEVRISEFNEMVHSFCPSERLYNKRDFENTMALMGPLLLSSEKEHTLLFAYEHGSQAPDAFVEFRLGTNQTISLHAVKGNYLHGQEVSNLSPYSTIWLEVAAVPGGEDDLADAYRTFVLRHMSLNEECRRPYIFYNTWAYQERNKWWNRQAYLDSMHQDRILSEIDIAHRMGIEVFVLDTGWYEKTGDWLVNASRFPDNLRAIKEKLNYYGMKLGLWFDPTKAAVSSKILNNHRDCVMTWNSKIAEPHQVWETEESYQMCLVSRYSDAFTETLIKLVDEVGVSYFKWDAIGQYGCNDPGHWHGSEHNSDVERANSYAFELSRQMVRIVDQLCQACPEAIVDFDITEGRRAVGLGFLSAGKYFLINNGPYFANYNISVKDQWTNVFVYPGPARTWICRTPLDYDKWIPSVLFLTHYLPDDPKESQMLNIASLILGQNGIWGDLLNVSPEGVSLFGNILGLYKQVRNDITESTLIRSGAISGSPEIHEKISKASGRGVVVVFSTTAGAHTYVTNNPVAQSHWCTEGVEVTFDQKDYAQLELNFEKPGAKIIYFGVN